MCTSHYHVSGSSGLADDHRICHWTSSGCENGVKLAGCATCADLAGRTDTRSISPTTTCSDVASAPATCESYFQSNPSHAYQDGAVRLCIWTAKAGSPCMPSVAVYGCSPSPPSAPPLPPASPPPSVCVSFDMLVTAEVAFTAAGELEPSAATGLVGHTATAQHLVEAIAVRQGVASRVLTSEAAGLLEHHEWPGNVRQLANVLERAMIVGEGPRLEAAELKALLSAESGRSEGDTLIGRKSTSGH